MSLSGFAVRRKTAVLMGVLGILLVGWVSFGRLPMDLFPDFSFPGAAVLATYGEAAPAEVEAHVTRPLEQALATVTNIRKVRSFSSEGVSVVVVEFNWGTSMDFAALEMRERVDQVRRFFPEEVGFPLVVKFDPSMLPVMLVSLTGGDDPVQLRDLGDGLVRERLERLEGVAAVSVSGGSVREVSIEVNNSLLAKLGISWMQLRAALASASVNLPGGKLTERGRDFLVRSLGKLEGQDQLEELVIGLRYQVVNRRTVPVPVRLKDVATVTETTVDTGSLSRLNGLDCLVLGVQKTSGANTVQVARAVAAELSTLTAELPAGAEFAVTMNQAEFIETSLQRVSSSALWGAALAVAVLFAFLLNIGSVVVIALSIPISVLATMALLYFGGLTLNLMTLSGLALGIGMLVDNSIVVLENIVRHVQDGTPPKEAAVKGASEVATAISASTLTTLAVFLPVVFVGGIAGTLFRDLSLTVSFALGASLLVAVTFVPMAASVLARPSPALPNGAQRGDRLSGLYGTVLGTVLKHRVVVAIVSVLAISVAILAGLQIGGEFLPRLDRGEFVITVEMPPGTALAVTDARIREIESLVMGLPEVLHVTSAVGGGSGMGIGGGAMTAQSTEGSVTVKLAPKLERERSTQEIMAALDRQIWVPGAQVTMEEMTFFAGAGFMTPVEVSIRGPDLAVLQDLAARLQGDMGMISGLTSVKASSRAGQPELIIEYDRDKLASLGLNPLAVSQQVKGALAGELVGSLEPPGGKELDVRLRYRAEDRGSLDRIKQIAIVLPTGGSTRLDQVATISESLGPTAIERDSGQRVITIAGGVTGRDLAGVTADIKAAAARLDMPQGYDITYGGEQQQMADAFSGLSEALILAVVLIYMVMAAQFESLLHPLVIMFTVPMAAIGALGLLYILGLPFSVSSVIGLILLAGIVVNNAIVLVDHVNQLRARGLARDVALVIGGRNRLRPILMTTLTTVLAMVPLAVARGEGSELAAPMAIAVIGGLTVSTLLTLLVIPAIYALADDAVQAVRRRGQPDPLRVDDLV
jgi:HAE1 family hydrophobic/amphiphilic exporter-1